MVSQLRFITGHAACRRGEGSTAEPAGPGASACGPAPAARPDLQEHRSPAGSSHEPWARAHGGQRAELAGGPRGTDGGDGQTCKEATGLTGGPGGPGGPFGPSRPRGPCKRKEQGLGREPRPSPGARRTLWPRSAPTPSGSSWSPRCPGRQHPTPLASPPHPTPPRLWKGTQRCLELMGGLDGRSRGTLGEWGAFRVGGGALRLSHGTALLHGVPRSSPCLRHPLQRLMQ